MTNNVRLNLKFQWRVEIPEDIMIETNSKRILDFAELLSIEFENQ
nr:hypothetical protein [Mycoplasmopsis bovis]